MVSRIRLAPVGTLVLVLALAWGCGGDGTGPEPTRMLAVHEGNNQTATVAQPVSIAPAVRVTTGSGSAVSGVAVTFAVTQGGGSVTGAMATTGADGVARVGGWTLGQVAGTNTLSAQLEGGGASTSISATGAADQPASVSKVAGDAQTALAHAAVPTAPAVRVADQFDNPVPGVAVTFEVTAGDGTLTGASAVTGVNGVATLGSWQLGPAAGPNTVTATVTGQGIANNPAVFSAVAVEMVLQPAQDTTIQGGTAQWTRVNIPANRTVTVAGNLVLQVDGSVVIAGTLQGNCVGLTIDGQQELNVSGTISNACTADTDSPPPLTLIGRGGFDVTAATLNSSGDIDLTNDPSLTDDDIPVFQGAAIRAAASIQPNGAVICGVGSLTAPQAKSGSDGQHGGDGRSGRTWTLRCRGDLSIGGTVAGQDGGEGGQGTDNTAGNATASGGDGGNGGRLVVRATGIVALGAGSTLRSGRGGHGGNATATAQESDAGTRAPAGVATGGSGGDPGLITVRAGNGVQVSAGATLQLGAGGNGGSATARGARGKDATTAKAAQHGGHAVATGGAGGSLDADKLKAFGNVLGAPAVSGGNGGTGGAATATAGRGGDASVESQPKGGDGGNFTATGGKGGDAEARNLLGNKFGAGGHGGAAAMAGGNGGFGWNGCSVTPPKAGGGGGKGGDAAGGDGAGGTGLANGLGGGVSYTSAGNGGAGGNGDAPGTGGAAGSQAGVTVVNGPAVPNGTTFSAGAPGLPCGIPEGKGVAQFTHLNVPDDGVPAVLARVKQGDNVIAEITSANQQVVLDPGTYLLESETIDPDGFQYVAGVCTIDDGMPTPSGAVAADPPGPCEFTVVEALLVTVVRTYIAQRALLVWLATGLPGLVAEVLYQQCELPGLCTGVTEMGVIPGMNYLQGGLWAIVVSDVSQPDGLRVNHYRAMSPEPLTLEAPTVYQQALAFYIFQIWYFYQTTSLVKEDPWGHKEFVALWLGAVMQLTRLYAEPSAVSPTSGEPVDVEITLTAPAPWVPLTGILKTDGTITASGSGTVAGFPNVPVTFTGVLNANGTISGELRMGQDTPPTGLPNGSIVYQIDGVPTAPPAAPPATAARNR